MLLGNKVKLYELLWLVSEIDRQQFFADNSKCSLECKDCETWPCKKANRFHRDSQSMREDPNRLYPHGKPIPCHLVSFTSVVLNKILKYCTQRDLMTLSRAFPQLTDKIMSPVFWRHIIINDKCLNEEEMLMLLQHVNRSVFSLSISVADDSIDLFTKIISLVPNLHTMRFLSFFKNLQLEDVLDVLAEKLPDLRHFISRIYLEIDDMQLTRFTKLCKIQKIEFFTLKASKENLGLVFSSIKTLKYVDFRAIENLDTK
jgi:hypothetical protein